MAFGDTATFTAVASGTEVQLQVEETGMTQARIWRYLDDGSTEVVRGTNDVDTPTALLAVLDHEAPPGVPLTYGAEITDGVTQVTLGPLVATGQTDYGGDWIMPIGSPGLGMNIYVERGGVGDLSRNVVRDVQPVLNRRSPVVVSHGRRFLEGEITFVTLTEAERLQLLDLLTFPATMFMFRTGYGFEQPIFTAIGNVVEGRTSGLGAEESRRWTMTVTKIDRPPPDYPYSVAGQTWAEVNAAYADWTDVNTNVADFYELAGYLSP